MGVRIRKKRNIGMVIFTVIASLLSAVVLLDAILEIGMLCVHNTEIYTPDYEMIDISGILEKGAENLTDEDYETLSAQTGLTKTGINRALAKGNSGVQKILRIQQNYFDEYSVAAAYFVPYCCQDVLADGKTTEMIYLESGDIIVTLSTHIAGWRMGHAALVTTSSGSILQASTIGTYSTVLYNYASSEFCTRVNFVVLSPKEEYVSAETKAQIASYAVSNLQGIPYNPTAGVFTDKYSIESTQCSHLVWYAYNHFGIDIDSDGGAIVTPADILASPYLEVVQIFGLNPNDL